MIDSKQFRRGNLVMAAGRLSRMDTINETDCFTEAIDPSAEADITKGLELIPITEEWLVKLGFVDGEYWINTGQGGIEKHHAKMIGKYGVEIYPTQICFFRSSEYRTETIHYNLEHVHELQNLYRVLTGKELEIK